MADPNENMEEAMMNIIAGGDQFDDENNQQTDDGSQYLDLDHHDEQEIAGEV